MRKAQTLFALGIWVAILPYLGFPGTIKNILYALTGLALMYLAYNKYRAIKRAERAEGKNFESYSENGGFDVGESLQ